MKEWFDHLLSYLFPPRCHACGKLLSRNETDLCDACREGYRSARDRNCPVCLKLYSECMCTTRYLDRCGVHRMAKLYRYIPGEDDRVENLLIYRVKRTNSEPLSRFVALELAPSVLRLIDGKSDYVLVNAPRSGHAVSRFGFDHSELLCRELSRILHIPYVPAVRRIGHPGPQKKLDRRERMAQAAETFAPNTKYDLTGKHVILVDDIVTTGATLAACAKCVRKLGAKRIDAAVIGVSYSYRALAGDRTYYHERQKYKLRFIRKRIKR